MALPISFRWDEGFVRRIDAARGDVPRSTWIRRAILERLERDEHRGDDLSSAEVFKPAGRVVRNAPKRQFTPIPKGKR